MIWGAAEGRAQSELQAIWPKVFVDGHITTSSPALSPDGTRVYIGVNSGTGGFNGQVVAIARDTGASLWARRAFERQGGIAATPAVSDDGRLVYIGGGNGVFYALNAEAAKVEWSFATLGAIDSSAAIGADGTVYFGSYDGNVYALDGASGAKKWAFKTGDKVLASPVIGADGTVYVGSRDRFFYALRPDGPDSDRVKWRFETGNAIDNAAAIAWDGTIYFTSDNQRFYAVNPDGTRKWEHILNGAVQASPVLAADGTIYVLVLDQYLYALRPEGPVGGDPVKWRAFLGQTNSASTPAVRGDGKIVFGADDGRVRVLNPDGSPWGEFNTAEDAIEGAPIVGPDGSIYFGADYLYRLRGNGSPLSTASSWPAFQHGITRNGRAEPARSAGQLVNLSVRAQVAATDTLIAGFVVQGGGEGGRVHLVRAAGPTLADVGVSGAMPDPRLQMFVHSPLPEPLRGGANEDWEDQRQSLFSLNQLVGTMDALGAFPLRAGGRDAALLALLPGGLYSAHATSADGRGGVALVEVYDARAGAEARLVNLSTRMRVGTGDNILIAGFVVGGTEKTRLLIRGVGPGLAQFGVGGVLTNPMLELYAQAMPGAAPPLLRRNVGWGSQGLAADIAAVGARVGAFALQPGSADCAMIVTVDPGLYTVQVSGVAGTTGEGMVEIYVVP